MEKRFASTSTAVLHIGCSTCQKIHHAPFPPEVDKGQLLGPRLTTLVAY